jgi:hypothetical protein
VKPIKKGIFFNKTKKSTRGIAIGNLGSRSGQAMVEYILLLIISVTLLFLAKNLFSNLNTYMNQYVGGYFRCLMVYGELPQLGISDKDLTRSSGKCSIQYKTSDKLALQSDGKSIGNTTIASKGSTKASASARGSGNLNSTKKTKKKNGESGERDSSASSSSTDYPMNIKNTNSDYSTADSEAGGRSQSIPLVDSTPDSSKTRKIPLSKEEQQSKMNVGDQILKSPKSKKIAEIEDDYGPNRVRKIIPPAPRDIANINDADNEQVGFGFYLKWLIIAGIGIALFILLGSQVMNYRNSDGGD